MTTTLSPTLTTTVRVIHWIHGRTTNMRATTQPTLATGFAEHNIHVIRIANLTHRSLASRWYTANLTTRERDLSPSPLASHKRRTRACTPTQDATTTSLQLNIMNRRTERNISQRQRIPNRRRCCSTGHNRCACRQAIRSDNVSLLAVHVVQQSNPGTPIRVILNGRNTGRNAVFITKEIDNSISPLMTATPVPHSNATLIISATGLHQRAKQ